MVSGVLIILLGVFVGMPAWLSKLCYTYGAVSIFYGILKGAIMLYNGRNNIK